MLKKKERVINIRGFRIPENDYNQMMSIRRQRQVLERLGKGDMITEGDFNLVFDGVAGADFKDMNDIQPEAAYSHIGIRKTSGVDTFLVLEMFTQLPDYLLKGEGNIVVAESKKDTSMGRQQDQIFLMGNAITDFINSDNAFQLVKRLNKYEAVWPSHYRRDQKRVQSY
ncbi:MAG: hypothetical protein JW754_04585 [Candidatus Aenigmarchaeota archaeon]|nr:hypothetical protein [Candidatus Aenigmarchaeota archaeon]